MIAVGLFTLMHLLVIIYWLGGDLGAFYGSTFLTDPQRSVAERMMALKILNVVDMSPRTATIAALPTGLALAWAKRWVDLPGWIPLLVAAASLGWLALAWAVHCQHGGGAALKRMDIAVRWALLAALFGLGFGGVTRRVDMPYFIALKLIVLGTCIGLGLIVRRRLEPMFQPIRDMVATGPTPATDAAIAAAIARTRPVVILIWICLLVAAWLGITTPV